jgi:hypothetical protein
MADSKQIMEGSIMQAMKNARSKESQLIMAGLSDEDAVKYKAIKGPGQNKRKAQIRLQLQSQKLGKASAVQTNTMSDKQEHFSVGTYMNYWQMVADLGGTVPSHEALLAAMKMASRVCAACEKMGAPAVMWDEHTGAMAPLSETHHPKSIISIRINFQKIVKHCAETIFNNIAEIRSR